MLREILVISFIFLFVSCSSKNEIDTNNKAINVALYEKGMNLLRKKEFDSAVEIFTELQIVKCIRYSSKSQLMAGFAQYMSNQYEEAILTLSKFIELNPSHSSVPYALYLKSLFCIMKGCLMLVLTKELLRALEEFTELINKHPKSKYAKNLGNM